MIANLQPPEPPNPVINVIVLLNPYYIGYSDQFMAIVPGSSCGDARAVGPGYGSATRNPAEMSHNIYYVN
jgi:hypothetical protein